MIIWKGYGVMVLVYTVVGLFIGAMLSDAAQTEHAWPFAVGLFIAAAGNFYTASKLEGNDRLVVDPETGEKLLLKRGDSLFFVPMKYWTWVMVALALLYAFMPASS